MTAFVYLVAIVAANLSVATFGPGASKLDDGRSGFTLARGRVVDRVHGPSTTGWTA